MSIYEHFGLSGAPFSVTPDPRFAFSTHEHNLALVKALYSIDERRGIFLLQGEIGTGKTTLSRFLLQGMAARGEKYVTAYLNSPPIRTEAGFLRLIMQVFELPTSRNLSDLMAGLLAFLGKNYEEGKTVVLLLDEAQMISPQCLDLLHKISNQQTLEAQLMQVVLFAQPNISKKLEQRPALRSRITGGAYLGQLSFEDAIEILRYRVTVAGGNFDKIFTEPTHKDIFNYSGGVARNLCILADSCLVNTYAAKRNAVTPEDVLSAIKDLRFKGWTDNDR